MAEKIDCKYHPHPEYRYWLHDPEGDGMTYWRTAEDRDKAAERVIAAYLSDCWAEETEYVCAGEVTHTAQVKDKRMRPDDLDEDGIDGQGEYWPLDMAWRGNYTLEPIGATTGKEPGNV
jgi:hypothetical protein